MTFKQPCFIRKNTSELRKKLEELGYKICSCATWSNSVWIDTFILGKEADVHGIGYSDSWEKISIEEECQRFVEENKTSLLPRIDCGTNEDLFLAIAALRDDTDCNQWFVDDTTGIWERTKGGALSKFMQIHGHKATLEEIMEHFKNKEETKMSIPESMKQITEAAEKLIAPADIQSSFIISEEQLKKQERRIIFQSDTPDKTELVLGDEFEVKVENGKTFVVRKESPYPKTFDNCLKILGYNIAHTIPMNHGHNGLLMMKLQRLLICRDAYWKLAGDWKPDYTNPLQKKFAIDMVEYRISFEVHGGYNSILAFPTEEMRDTFYENFKDLIEECKELL